MSIFSASISICISLGFLLCFYVLWRDYWIDEIRDRLFALRDEMFLYAYDNNLLETPAYNFMRGLINSVIRYAHEISAGRFLILVIAHAFMRVHSEERFLKGRKSINDLPVIHRDQMMNFHNKMGLLIGRQIIKTSFVLRSIAALINLLLWFSQGDDADAKHEMTDKMPVSLLEQDAFASCPA